MEELNYNKMKYLTNIDFVLWCLRGCPPSGHWASYIKSHSEDKELLFALNVMGKLRTIRPKMSAEEKQELFDSILDDKKSSGYGRVIVKHLRHISIGFAACLLLGAMAYAATLVIDRVASSNSVQIAELSSIPMPEHIRVICGGEVYDCNSISVARIRCAESGVVSVNEQNIDFNSSEGVDILIPTAHRAIITLADKTKVWLNGNTKFRIGEFSDSQRSVEIDGEGYFEVFHNPEAPFTVYSRMLNTTVKGTSFNVYSTSNVADTHHVVLVDGSVEVEIPSLAESVTLTPSQIINYNNDSYMTTTTDVSRYTRWHDGSLTIDSDSVAEVTAKLAEYYGVEAVCDDQTSKLSCSGRLVLFDDINQTLTVLESIIPITYSWKGGKLYISLEK